MSNEKKKVLIVDDEEDLTWSISRGLAKDRDNFEVLATNSGQGALTMLSKYPIAVVVTDLRMPGIGGFQLLDEVAAHYPNTKVIVMTAYGSIEIKEILQNTKANWYIEKPFEINELRKLIYQCLTESTQKNIIQETMEN